MQSLLVGRFRGRATIHDARRSDLALGKLTARCAILLVARDQLSGLSGAIRVASRRDRHLPYDYGGSPYASNGVECSGRASAIVVRSEEHTSELQSPCNL